MRVNLVAILLGYAAGQTTVAPADSETTAVPDASTVTTAEPTTTAAPTTADAASTTVAASLRATTTAMPASSEDMLRWTPLDEADADVAPGLRKRPGVAAVGSSVYVFGGEVDGESKNDVWMFDLETRTWSELAVVGDTFPSGRFDAMVGIYKNVLYVSGGEGLDASGVREFYGDLWGLDLSTLTWTEVDKDATTRPAPRYGHAGGVVGNKFITSHGFASARLKDTLSWDLDSGSDWEVVIADNVDPIPRCLMGVTTSSTHLYMYGGCGSPGGPCPMSDLWAFNVESGQWELLEDGPYALNDADMAYTSEGEVVLVGGTGGTDQQGNEVHTYTNGSWSSAVAESDALSASNPIYNHRMVGIESDDPSMPTLVSFGGTNSGGRIWGLFGAPTESQVVSAALEGQMDSEVNEMPTTTTGSPGAAGSDLTMAGSALLLVFISWF